MKINSSSIFSYNPKTPPVYSNGVFTSKWVILHPKFIKYFLKELSCLIHGQILLFNGSNLADYDMAILRMFAKLTPYGAKTALC